jgi:RTX calcium-binding nonapeptide repeat (4 copies)
MRASPDPDLIEVGAGFDFIIGDSGADQLFGGGEIDFILAGAAPTSSMVVASSTPSTASILTPVTAARAVRNGRAGPRSARLGFRRSVNVFVSCSSAPRPRLGGLTAVAVVPRLRRGLPDRGMQ